MCGIIGQVLKQANPHDNFAQRQELLKHRGPDDAGFYISADKKVSLGHQRLSILDLSSRGHQPMSKNNCWIVYNGEIYNFKELRTELTKFGYKFFSQTDTEVVLTAYLHYGSDCVKHFDGMFAFGIWDENKQQLFLARDRFGVKPLYYFYNHDRLVFASEIQSLGALQQINHKAVARFIYQNYFYGTETIWQNVFKLSAASTAVYQLANHNLVINKYWQAKFSDQYQDLASAKIRLAEILSASVKQSLVSDVPVGVFLSSGIDSSLIAALTKKHLGQVDTFTVAFDFNSYDESKAATKIAKILGTHHQVISLDQKEVVAKVPEILENFSEPFGDSSAIPTYFLSKFVSSRVKVCLSGDGADELFAGYPIYYLPKYNNFYKKFPGKKLIEKFVDKLPTSSKKMSLDYKLSRFVKAAKYNYSQAHFYYRRMRNHGVLNDDGGVADDFSEYFKDVQNQDILNQLLYVDQQTVLEGDYLVKVDRMSMVNSLEVRVPFLNNAVIDFANSLAPNLKIKGWHTKYILKKLLEDYLPTSYIYTSKKGFSVPMADWLRNDLRDFMLDSLSVSNIKNSDLFNYEQISLLIKKHLTKERDYSRELWGLISLVNYLNKCSGHSAKKI